ncbi:MAG: hypothetical protein ACLP1D_13415 [Xanthobacteraceae bacterium]
MKPDQGMLAKMPIECRAIGFGKEFALASDDPPCACFQVADAQGREIGSDDTRQLLERCINERRAARALTGKQLQRAQGRAQVMFG